MLGGERAPQGTVTGETWYRDCGCGKAGATLEMNNCRCVLVCKAAQSWSLRVCQCIHPGGVRSSQAFVQKSFQMFASLAASRWLSRCFHPSLMEHLRSSFDHRRSSPFSELSPPQGGVSLPGARMGLLGCPSLIGVILCSSGCYSS